MNKTSNLRRLMNETKQINTEKESYASMFELKMVGEDIYHWTATVYGPEDSLYENYQFELDIKLPEDYPTSAINVKFITHIEHANVNKNGDICMDILKDKWTSALNIRTVLISLISLMNKPNLDDPFNSDLVELYRKDEKQYIKKIKDACKKYAKKHTIKTSEIHSKNIVS